MRRDAICGRIWPELPEHSARASLRNALWHIAKRTAGVVEVVGSDIQLSSLVQVDLWQLREVAWSILGGDPAAPVPAAREVLAVLKRAELLPGWYDEWLETPREELRQLRLHALESLAHRLIADRQIALALETALEATRIEPLRESAAATVIAAHLAEQNVVEALRYYQRFADRLGVELGVRPSLGLQQQLAGALKHTTSSRGAHVHHA